MSRILLSFAVFLTVSRVAFGQILVRGTVLGAGDIPMKAAHVSLMYLNETTPVQTVQADSAGHFAMNVPATGVWMVRWEGVGHREYQTALYVEKAETIAVQVVLGAYQYNVDFGKIAVIGDFNRWYPLSGVPMAKQADGTFIAEVSTPADTLGYRLVGVRNGGPLEGTQAERYSYNSTDGYASILPVHNGKIRVVFDPSLLCRTPSTPSIQFSLSSSVVARVSRIYDELQAYQDSSKAAFRAFVRQRKGEGTPIFDWTAALDGFRQQLRTEKDPIVREALGVAIISVCAMAKSNKQPDYVEAFKALKPSSRMWAIGPHAMAFALLRCGYSRDEQMQYLDQFVAENPDERIKSLVLCDAFMIARFADEKNAANKYYDLLAEKYAGTQEGRYVLGKFSRQSDFKLGSRLPGFSVRSLDDSSIVFTDQTFRGKYLLVTFWKSTEKECQGQLADLRTAYGKYGKNRLAILSVSLDDSIETVTGFLRARAKAPWMHTFLKRGIKDRMANDFVVTGVPSLYLIDPSGKCVAMGSDLSGKSLLPALRKHLGK